MRLGPIHEATLVVHDLDRALAGYVDQLGLTVVETRRLAPQRALDMGDAALADARCARLRSAADSDPWLTLIECPNASRSAPAARRGWIELSLAVADIDALASRLDPLIWPQLMQPASLPPSADDRLLRVAGADGEVLKLTASLQSPAPARCAVDRVYSATLAAQDCGTALGFYSGLGLVAQRRVALPPAALGQLRGGDLLEIRQLPLLPAADATLRTGIRMLGFARSDATGRRLAAHDDPSARILAGPEGEAIELV